MDPLSVTTSVLAVVGAGGQVARSIRRILELKSAPEALLALNNEVNDVELIIQDVQILLEQCNTSDITPPVSLKIALEQIKTTLLAVESFVAYDLTVITSDGTLRIDKSRWIRAKEKIQTLKESMKSNKLALSVSLSILSSLEADTHARQVIVSMKDFDDQLKGVVKNLVDQLSCLKARQRVTEVKQRRPTRYHPLSNQSCTTRVSPSHGEMTTSEPFNDAVTDKDSASLLRDTSHADRLGDVLPSKILLPITSSRSCSLNCLCTCHKTKSARSKIFLNNTIGSLFVGYNIRPWCLQACDDPQCQTGTAHFTYNYAFPTWLIRRVLFASITYTYSSGPELVLRIMRVRSVGTPAFSCVYECFEESSPCQSDVKKLMDDAKASVLDVTKEGRTLLHAAVLVEQYETAEMLVRLGADILFQDRYGLSPYSIFWSKALVRGQASSQENTSKLFDQSLLGIFGFTELQRAYFQLSNMTFKTVLKSTDRSEIDSADHSGRTTLSWAANKGDFDTMSTLLICGADPNKADQWGMTPLHWSAGAANWQCVQLLLDAKAQIDCKDHQGQTPLMIAAGCVRGGPATLKILLRFGADLEANCSIGLTASYCHENMERPRSIRLLLENGANMDISDDYGGTVCHYALAYRKHRALRTLLFSRAPDQIQILADPWFLNMVAGYGDGVTIGILSSIEKSVSIGQATIDGMLELARFRRDRSKDCELSHWGFEKPPSAMMYTLSENPDRWFTRCEKFAQQFMHTVDCSSGSKELS